MTGNIPGSYGESLWVLLVPDWRRIQHANVIYCQLSVSQVWLGWCEGDAWGWTRGWAGLWKWGSWFWAWDQYRPRVASLRKWLLPQVRGFLLLFSFNTHVLELCYKHYKLACVSNKFSPLKVKNNHVTEISNMHLFLGPIAWLGTLLARRGESTYAKLLL